MILSRQDLTDASQNGKRELSYREICQTMGRNLRIISPSEPEQEQLDLFEAAQESGDERARRGIYPIETLAIARRNYSRSQRRRAPDFDRQSCALAQWP
jgi:hypothetical protein